MLTESFRRSAFNCPGNLANVCMIQFHVYHNILICKNRLSKDRANIATKKHETEILKETKNSNLRQVVTPDIVRDTRWLRSP